ncbi:hypothetical protein M758_12G073300 [Ceratodon purpureus]|nr:hypothetical protein M758_12G073300 [Ceratodon purpureus]
MYRRMDLRPALWSQLPFEILKKVLLFVPVPNLCRFRSVSKRWNQLIGSHEFGAQCAQKVKQHATGQVSDFIVLQYTHYARIGPHRKRRQFCFLDLNSRRWSRHSNATDGVWDSFDYPSVDMDGGLVVGSNYEEGCGGPVIALVVSNLTTPNTRKELPSPPDHPISLNRSHFCLLNLVVDNSTQNFTVFLISFADWKFMKIANLHTILVENPMFLYYPILRVYNSVTNEWRTLTNPSQTCSERKSDLKPVSIVMLQDFPHILFTSRLYRNGDFDLGYEFLLWRYNLHKDLWEDMHCRPDHSGKLIVSANRLFLVGWSLVGRGRRQFNVTEINVPEKTCESLFTWTEAQVVDVFDIQGDLSNLWNYSHATPVDKSLINIHVTGFDNSLMFTSFVTPGKLISFDFVKNKFDRNWPPLNPLKDLSDKFAYGDFCAWKQMNLLLPGTPF